MVAGFAYDILGSGPAFGIALAFVAVFVRYRRSRGLERQQMKWFLATVALLVTASLLAGVSDALLFVFTFLLALAFLPIAVGIAVLRYRLYDIDRLISRTIGWALVTGILAAVFVGVVLALQALLAGLHPGRDPRGRRVHAGRVRAVPGRCGGGSRLRSIGGSTGRGTTGSARSMRLRSGCAMRWSSRRYDRSGDIRPRDPQP